MLFCSACRYLLSGSVIPVGPNGEMVATVKITTVQNLRESNQATQGQKRICSPLSLGSYSITYKTYAVGYRWSDSVKAAHRS